MNRMMSTLLPTKPVGKITAALLVAALFLVVLALSACAGPMPVPTSVQVPVPTAEAASAVFQVDGLSIHPAQGYTGQQVIITAVLKNRGRVEGKYTAELKVNNAIEERKEVALPAGAAIVMNFATFMKEAGTYIVDLGGLSGQFEVIGNAPATTGASSSCCGG